MSGTRLKICAFVILTLAMMSSGAIADDVKVKISGPGAVDANTIKAGEKVSVDIYAATDTARTGFTLGFTLKSKDISNVIHVADSGNGLNKNGDIKGHNGWNDKSVWDFGGVFAVERDWDGKLPELLGFGGLSIKKGWEPTDLTKTISFEIIVPEAGTLVLDSAYYPPGGKWLFSSPPRLAGPSSPGWDGPHTFKVVK
ncbi:MAG: hypothetical protein P1R58_04000 [bacterium]|nr:hypothetical protein [bacterium]